MKIVVLGAGLAGVSAVHALLRDGHQVQVLERAAAAAAETSFANAGLVSPGHAFSWASPSAPMAMLRSLFKQDQALRVRSSLDPAFWRWGLNFLANCTQRRWVENSRRLVRLAKYSQQSLSEVVTQTGIDHAATRRGILYLYADQKALTAARQQSELLLAEGVEVVALSTAEALDLEPQLAAWQERTAGALYCPGDESGDAWRFTTGLAAWCAARGAEFNYGATIEALRARGNRIVAVQTDRGEIAADAFVVSVGSHAPALLRPLGYRVPIYPVRGNSVTFPIREGDRPPRIAGVDDGTLTAWSRLGERLRLTSTAEFSGYANLLPAKDVEVLVARARAMFPNGADFDQASPWSCLRPMTPTGTPIIGRTRHDNLYVHIGHGAMGWTTASGTAQMLADVVAGRNPVHPMAGLDAGLIL